MAIAHFELVQLLLVQTKRERLGSYFFARLGQRELHESEDPAVLWDRYIQLTQIEAAFKCLKSDLGIRPIFHQLEHRVDAHILVAFLAYCLTVTLKHRLQRLAPGLTPRAALEKLATIQMLDVVFPTTDGRCLIMPRYTEPDPDQALLLHQMDLALPQQPPPRIAAQTPDPPAVPLKM